MSEKKSFWQKVRYVFYEDPNFQAYQGSSQIPPPQQTYLPDGSRPSSPQMLQTGLYPEVPNGSVGQSQSSPVQNPARVYPAVGIGISREEVKNQEYVHLGPIGSSGTRSYSGYPREEYLQKLMGWERAEVFDQMKRSDSAIKMCLSAVKNPIKAAAWDIEPADAEDQLQVEIGEFIHFVLFENADKPFDEFISEALTFVEQGHSVFEIIDKVVLDDPIWGNFVGIKSLAWRSQKTILRWYLDGDTGELTGIMQLAYGDVARNVTIPAAFLLVFTMDKEGSNYEGISMLRPAYGSWWRKDNYLKINAIGIEKFAIPTPLVEVPKGQENSQQYNSLIAALQIYTTHQANYLTYPEGWKIDIKTSSYDPSKVETSIDNEDKRIAKAFLGNFLELGMGGASSGNRAMSEDLSAFFLGGIEYIANEFCGYVNKGLIKRIVDLKYGPQSKYPTLKARGITDKAGLAFGQLLKALADAQYITPDDPLEEHLRKRLGLPKMSKTGQRAVKAVGAAGVEGPANPSYSQLSERIRLAEDRRLYALRNLELKELTGKGRKQIKSSNFVFPEDKRYPIQDISHARNALARSSGTPDEAKVKAAVYRKYPELNKK